MSEPKYYPILFTGEMVRANLDGRKTQTRRVVKPMVGEQSQWLTPEMIDKVPHGEMIGGGWQMHHPLAGTIQACIPIPHNSPYGWIRCPYGQPGNRLWVREAHRFEVRGAKSVLHCVYAADDHAVDMFNAPWLPSMDRNRPPMFLPRWASRITLGLTGVRVERVQDISEADAVAEGMEFRGGWWSGSNHQVKGTPKVFPSARDAFLDLFYNLRKRADPNENPWVWVLDFKRVEARA